MVASLYKAEGEETEKATCIRTLIYGFNASLILIYLAFDADFHVDLRGSVHLLAMLTAGCLLIAIRSNPGIVSVEVEAREATHLEEELSKDGQATENLGLSSTVRMVELKANLLVPELKATSTLGNWKLAGMTEGLLEGQEKSDSGETYQELL